MIFFYEMLFVLVAVASIGIGEHFNPLWAFIFLAGWFLFVTLGYASFGARIAASGSTFDEDEARWYQDARDGLRHLRLLFGIAAALALVWRLLTLGAG